MIRILAGSIFIGVIQQGDTFILDFIKRAYNGDEIARIYNEDGSVGHAEIRIVNAVVMMFDAKEEWLDTPSYLRLYMEGGYING